MDWNEAIKNYPSEAFGNSPQMAEELAQLILEGKKTATSSLLWCYKQENEPLPEVGRRLVVLDGKNNPACVIENTKVQILPFNQVDASVAYAEGEGDRSLKEWRRGHREFFLGECPEFEESMEVVTEWFKVLHRF